MPQVPLPYVTVGAFHEVAVGHAFVEHGRFLGHVGVDPDADAQAALLQSAQHRFGIGEDTAIPLKVHPLKFLHPETVEVKDAQRQVAVGHPLDEAGHRCFVVGSGERSAQPQPKGPGGRQRRATGERGVAAEDVLGRGAVDDEVVQRFAGDAELHPLHLL